MLAVIKKFLRLLSIVYRYFNLGNQLLHLTNKLVGLRVDGRLTGQ